MDSRLSSGLYCSYGRYQGLDTSQVDKKERARTAWYDGVRVVILWRFRAYSKKKCLTFSAT